MANVYKVVVTGQNHVITSNDNRADVKIFSVTEEDFLSAARKADEILLKEYRDMRIINIKETTTNVR